MNQVWEEGWILGEIVFPEIFQRAMPELTQTKSDLQFEFPETYHRTMSV
jgi:hypothetical protein